jgi:heme/copper-type cytochrome/quinol oxidase subunit 2
MFLDLNFWNMLINYSFVNILLIRVIVIIVILKVIFWVFYFYSRYKRKEIQRLITQVQGAVSISHLKIENMILTSQKITD